jgi:hypothetical protein
MVVHIRLVIDISTLEREQLETPVGILEIKDSIMWVPHPSPIPETPAAGQPNHINRLIKKLRNKMVMPAL